MKIVKNDGTKIWKFHNCKYLFESNFKGKRIYAKANVWNLLSLPFVKLGMVKLKKRD